MIVNILLIVIILFVIALLLLEKRKNNSLEDKIKNLMDNIEQKFTSQNTTINNQMQNMLTSLDNKINNQNAQVKFDFQTQSEISNNNLKEIIQRVSTIEATKSQMQDLSQNINQLQNIFTNKKARGSLGEMQLYNIFVDMFGEKSTLYEVQKKLGNGKIVDLLFHAPMPLGDICIDSKFPLEAYLKLEDVNLNVDEKKEIQKQFIRDLKKHIIDISEKYITEDTANQAVMFIPSEAIFTEIITNFEEIVSFAYASKVWITSPTTIMAILNVIQIAIKDLKRAENADKIHEQVALLAKEFTRYQTRWESLYKHFQTVGKDLDDIEVTTNKIVRKFEAIEKVEIADE